MRQITDPRKWILAAVAAALFGVVAIFAYLSFHAAPPVQRAFTVAPHYLARNVVDLSRMPDASFLQITESDHVRVEDEQDGISRVQVLDGAYRGERGWVRTEWLLEVR